MSESQNNDHNAGGSTSTAENTTFTLDMLPPALKLNIMSMINVAPDDQGDDNTTNDAAAAAADGKQPTQQYVVLTTPPKVFHLPINDDTHEKLSYFSVQDLQALTQKGFIVRDTFLADQEVLKQTRIEAQSYVEEKKLRPARMKAKKMWTNSSLRGDHMLWIHQDDTPENLCTVLKHIDALRNELNVAAGLDCERSTSQLAYYPGTGARYAKHLDAYPGGPERRLTLLLYLNPDWKDTDGGCLRIHLPDGTTTDIEPQNNRLVVFLSQYLEHEVMPAHAARFAITTWLY
jgi:SM-20-related protein